jgi:hypothetical protein
LKLLFKYKTHPNLASRFGCVFACSWVYLEEADGDLSRHKPGQVVFNSWLFHPIPQVPQLPPAQPPQPPPVPAMAWDGPLSPLLKAAKSEMARDVRIPSHCLH